MVCFIECHTLIAWRLCAGFDMVVEIADCIGGHGLAAVCRLLAEDHAGWSGTPSSAVSPCAPQK